MSDVKKKLLEEIDRKIARKKEIRAQAAQKIPHESYVMDFIKDIEDLTATKVEGSTWLLLMNLSLDKLEKQMKSIDGGSKVEVSWHTQDGHNPQVNGVLIKWSPYYQGRYNLEPELFVDITSLMLK